MGCFVGNLFSTLCPDVVEGLPANTNTHPLSVQRMPFSEVHYVKFDFLPHKVRIMLNRKVEPLMMSLCVGVNAHV